MQFFSVISTKVDKLCPNCVLYAITTNSWGKGISFLMLSVALAGHEWCLFVSTFVQYILWVFFSFKKPNEIGKSQIRKVNLWAAESKQWRDVKTLQARKTSFS